MKRILVLIFASLLLSACNMFGGGSDFESNNIRTVGVTKTEVDSESLLRMARGFEETGDFDTAIRIYANLSQKNPSDVQPILGQARIYDKTGRFSKAGELYLDALLLAPQNSEAVAGTMLKFVRQNNPDAAISMAENYLETGAGTLTFWTAYGLSLDIAGHHEEAQIKYGEALAISPNDPATLANLALSLALSGEVESGEAILELLLENPAVQQETLRNMAMVRAVKRDYVGAENLLDVLYKERIPDRVKETFYALDEMPVAQKRRIVMLGMN